MLSVFTSCTLHAHTASGSGMQQAGITDLPPVDQATCWLPTHQFQHQVLPQITCVPGNAQFCKVCLSSGVNAQEALSRKIKHLQDLL